jgi:hypothetical protein
MPDDTEAVALRARLEAIIKKAEDVEAQAATARRRIQAARLLLAEESKATALEQMATAARQRVPPSPSSASSPAAASPLVPTASSTYEDMVIAGLHLQAVAVLNVRQLVNIVLDSSSTNSVHRSGVDSAGQRRPQVDQQPHLSGSSPGGPGTRLHGAPPLAHHREPVFW